MLTDLISRCVFSIRISGNAGENNGFATLVHQLITPLTGVQSLEYIIWSHTFPLLKKLKSTSVFKPELVAKFVNFF